MDRGNRPWAELCYALCNLLLGRSQSKGKNCSLLEAKKSKLIRVLNRFTYLWAQRCQRNRKHGIISQTGSSLFRIANPSLLSLPIVWPRILAVFGSECWLSSTVIILHSQIQMMSALWRELCRTFTPSHLWDWWKPHFFFLLYDEVCENSLNITLHWFNLYIKCKKSPKGEPYHLPIFDHDKVLKFMTAGIDYGEQCIINHYESQTQITTVSK